MDKPGNHGQDQTRFIDLGARSPPFEVTPFLIHLSRVGASEGKQNPASSTSAQRQR